MVNCTNTVLVTHHFVQFLFIGQTKSACTLCRKHYICIDRNNKLASSSLKIHLLKAHSSNPQVRAEYLLDELDKQLIPTPRQTKMRFAKSAGVPLFPFLTHILKFGARFLFKCLCHFLYFSRSPQSRN